jgi:hypothetical protein
LTLEGMLSMKYSLFRKRGRRQLVLPDAVVGDLEVGLALVALDDERRAGRVGDDDVGAVGLGSCGHTVDVRRDAGDLRDVVWRTGRLPWPPGR